MGKILSFPEIGQTVAQPSVQLPAGFLYEAGRKVPLYEPTDMPSFSLQCCGGLRVRYSVLTVVPTASEEKVRISVVLPQS